MKNWKTTLIGMFLLSICSFGVYSQESEVSAGGEATSLSGTGSLSYSIGQGFYATKSGVDGTMSDGVQHAYEIYPILGLDYQDEITLECMVYPNPTIDFMTLDINEYSYKHLSYALFDLNGKIFRNEKLRDQLTVIDCRDLPASIYFLKVTDKSNVLGAFKIVKK